MSGRTFDAKAARRAVEKQRGITDTSRRAMLLAILIADEEARGVDPSTITKHVCQFEAQLDAIDWTKNFPDGLQVAEICAGKWAYRDAFEDGTIFEWLRSILSTATT